MSIKIEDIIAQNKDILSERSPIEKILISTYCANYINKQYQTIFDSYKIYLPLR